MRNFNYFSPKFALTLALFIYVLALFDFILHRPPGVNKVFEKALVKKTSVRFFKIPQRGDIQEYLKLAKSKAIFYFPNKRETGAGSLEKKQDPLADLLFNGIIILDKKYVAIFSKKDKRQYLVSEGQSVKGIKIKKIKQSSVMIEVGNEEKEINF